MSVHLVVERELRAQARRPGTWLLRLLAASLAVGGLTLAYISGEMEADRNGASLFWMLNGFAVFFLFIISPALTADLVSRERREGTLPLLFLAGLSAKDVLLGKSIAAIIRAFTLWLGAAPVLLLPLLMGGVSGQEIAAMLGIQGAGVAFGLVCGLLSSALSRTARRAQAVAYAFMVMNAFLAGLFGGTFLAALAPWSVLATFITGLAGFIGFIWFLFKSAQSQLEKSWGLDSLELNANENPWAEKITSAAEVRECVEPWLKRRIEHRLRRLLDHAPLRWLSARKRTTPFPWALWMLFVITIWLMTGFHGPARFAPFLMLVMLSVVSTRVYREERGEGTLELLLCTPQPVRAFLTAPLTNVLQDFGPAFLLHITLLVVFWHASATRVASHAATVLAMVAAMPVVGLWASLKLRSGLMAWLTTVVLVGLWPVYLTALGAILVLGVITVACWKDSLRMIARRSFVMRPMSA